MRTLIALLLPILMPSWRFFDRIEGRYIIEWRFLDANARVLSDWHPCHTPRPHISSRQMLRQLFWNPTGNEALFMLSCAERLAAVGEPRVVREIETRIWRAAQPQAPHLGYLQFRVRFVSRVSARVVYETRFTAPPRRITAGELA